MQKKSGIQGFGIQCPTMYIVSIFRYDCQGQLVEPFLIGICGGSASGKTTVADKIIKVTHLHPHLGPMLSTFAEVFTWFTDFF